MSRRAAINQSDRTDCPTGIFSRARRLYHNKLTETKMAKTTYTNEQLSAMGTRDKTLLVSAAAGAGKTATLTERIICSLIGKKDPNETIGKGAPLLKAEKINEMLIVTFTKAAAAELRERISAALKGAVAECHTGAYIEKELSNITEKLARHIGEDESAFINSLWKILHACPSEAIRKKIVGGARELRESCPEDELLSKITEMIKEIGEECDPISIVPALEEQLYLLPSARISTIDSFCYDILKSNAEKCGVPPRCRIGDQIEASVLEHTVWTERIDAAFEGLIPDISPEEFEEVAVSLTGVKSDKALEESFEFLYDKSKSSERGVKIFTDIREALEACGEKKLEDIPHVAYAMGRVKECAEYHAQALTKMITELCGSAVGIDERVSEIKARAEYIAERTAEYQSVKPKAKKDELIAELGFVSFEDNILVSMYEDLEILKNISDADTYLEMQAALDLKFGTIPSPNKKQGEEKTPESIEYQNFRNEFMKKALTALKEKFFIYTPEQWYLHVKALARLMSVIEKFIQSFDKIYFGEKIKRGMLEFSDVERKVFELLYDENGEPNEVARSLREQFSSVYIDEYQDVNAIQNKIFLAISKDDNRFTVGDIKQSIYGFRSAKPEIFKDMKAALPPLEESEDESGASVFMSQNFRCDEIIIDFVNEIFDEMFTMTAEPLGYTSKDKLVFAKKYKKGEAPNGALPEVMLFSKPEKASDKNAAQGDDSESKKDDDESEGSEDVESSDKTPEWVTEKVKELLAHGRLNNGDRIEPQHIAILLRKNMGRSIVYKEALERKGIRASTPDTKSFFLNGEIQLALCLLNTINNPLKDIYLAGLMLSPLFGFTPSELYKIKKRSKSALWYKINEYAKAEGGALSQKCARFTEQIRKYRTVSEGMRVDELIQRLYNETGLLTLGLGSGCKENLMLLYNYAKDFEASSYEGLYSFINYVNTVIERGETFQTRKEESEKGAVTIMTAHSSKGLEFPVVILADAATALISKNEKSAKIAYNEELGIAFNTRYANSIALVNSPVRHAIIEKNIEKSIEEELRIYYVALTRARERLYITASPNAKSEDEYLAKANIRKKYKTPYLLRQVKTFVDILYAVDSSAVISWDERRDTPPAVTEVVEKAEDAAAEALRLAKERVKSAASLAMDALSLAKEAVKECQSVASEGEKSSKKCDTGAVMDAISEAKAEIEMAISAAEDAVLLETENTSADAARALEGAKDAEEIAYKAESIILLSELEERFAYEYPDMHLTRLPEKMSISRLSPRLLDSEETVEGGEAEISKTIDGESEIGEADEAFSDGDMKALEDSEAAADDDLSDEEKKGTEDSEAVADDDLSLAEAEGEAVSAGETEEASDTEDSEAVADELPPSGGCDASADGGFETEKPSIGTNSVFGKAEDVGETEQSASVAAGPSDGAKDARGESPTDKDGASEERIIRRHKSILPKFYKKAKTEDSAKRGIATHNVLQFMDVERLEKQGASAEIDALIKSKFLSNDDGKKVFVDEIEKFRASELFKNMLRAHRDGRNIWREFRFSVLLPAPLFAETKQAKELYKDESILLQGIIDCLYEDENGDLHLVDYKTDRIKREENAKEQLSCHATQLTYYAIAVKKIFGKYPDTVSVYSLPLGRTIDIEPSGELEEFQENYDK